MNESVALGAGDLLAMLAGDSEEEDESGDIEEDIDDDEERDIVTDLHGQFVEAELNKRKRESEGGGALSREAGDPSFLLAFLHAATQREMTRRLIHKFKP